MEQAFSESQSQRRAALAVSGNARSDRPAWTCQKCGDHHAGLNIEHPILKGQRFIIPPPVEGDCMKCAEAEHKAFMAEQERRANKEISERFMRMAEVGTDYRNFTFDQFEYQPGTEQALARARHFVETFEEPNGKWLLLFGPPGNGKTSLAMAIRNEIEKRHACQAIAITQASLLLEIRKSWERRGGDGGEQPSEGWIMERLQRAQFVLIDDLMQWKEWAEERMFLLLDGRYRTKRKMVFTSNHTPDQLEKMLGERLWSRFVGSTEMVRNDGPDYRKQVQRKRRMAD